MSNSNLSAAKRAKNDEFYTMYSDIETEMRAYVEYDPNVFRDKTILLPCDDPEWSNFTKYFTDKFEEYGIKKLISTSYANGEGEHGKLFVLERGGDVSRSIGHLKDDGDFRSEEVTALRDEADIIITNPPFSLFREFLAWIMKGGKQFVIIGNMNAITYKEVFPLLKDNQIWTGDKCFGGGMNMIYPEHLFDPNKVTKYSINKYGEHVVNIMGVIWFTNIDLIKRHRELKLTTMADNLKFNKKLRKKLERYYGVIEYPHYDNYDAIEVPFTECIPSDYDGVMGVPITFMDKYNPEQFELIKFRKGNDDKDLSIDGKCPYFRILIRGLV